MFVSLTSSCWLLLGGEIDSLSESASLPKYSLTSTILGNTLKPERGNENESEEWTLSVRDEPNLLFADVCCCCCDPKLWWIVLRAGTEVVLPIFIFPGCMYDSWGGSPSEDSELKLVGGLSSNCSSPRTHGVRWEVEWPEELNCFLVFVYGQL